MQMFSLHLRRFMRVRIVQSTGRPAFRERLQVRTSLHLRNAHGPLAPEHRPQPAIP